MPKCPECGPLRTARNRSGGEGTRLSKKDSRRFECSTCGWKGWIWKEEPGGEADVARPVVADKKIELNAEELEQLDALASSPEPSDRPRRSHHSRGRHHRHRTVGGRVLHRLTSARGTPGHERPRDIILAIAATLVLVVLFLFGQRACSSIAPSGEPSGRATPHAAPARIV